MSASILSKLKEGNAPLTIRQSAARGVLPVGQEELLGILVYLQNDPEEEIRDAARQTLANEYSDNLLLTIAESDTAPVEVLEYFGRPPLRSPRLWRRSHGDRRASIAPGGRCRRRWRRQ